MKNYLLNNKRIVIIKEVLIIVVVFFLFSFIGIDIAIFVSALCGSIIIIKKKILNLNPGHGGKNKIITNNGRKLIVPRNIEIFELKDYTTFETLREYTEALRFILIPSSILIIRFNKQILIDISSAQLIRQVIKQLSQLGIRAVFTDVNFSIYNQLEFHDILQIIEGRNLFANIEDIIDDIKGDR